jgi:hypothetical protein
MLKYFDVGSVLVIITTFLLFLTALFVKGFTHDLLLEAGVMLVSVKLIMMTYKNSLNYSDIKKDLREIKQMLDEK